MPCAPLLPTPLSVIVLPIALVSRRMPLSRFGMAVPFGVVPTKQPETRVCGPEMKMPYAPLPTTLSVIALSVAVGPRLMPLQPFGMAVPFGVVPTKQLEICDCDAKEMMPLLALLPTTLSVIKLPLAPAWMLMPFSPFGMAVPFGVIPTKYLET